MEVTAYVFCFVVGPAFDVWWKWIFSGQFITCSFTTVLSLALAHSVLLSAPTPMKNEFWNTVNIWRSCEVMKFWGLLFMVHPVHVCEFCCTLINGWLSAFWFTFLGYDVTQIWSSVIYEMFNSLQVVEVLHACVRCAWWCLHVDCGYCLAVCLHYVETCSV